MLLLPHYCFSVSSNGFSPSSSSLPVHILGSLRSYPTSALMLHLCQQLGNLNISVIRWAPEFLSPAQASSKFQMICSNAHSGSPTHSTGNTPTPNFLCPLGCCSAAFAHQARAAPSSQVFWLDTVGSFLHSSPFLIPKLICQHILGASALKTHGFLHLAPPSTPLASQTWMLPGTCFIPLAASSPACTVTLLAHPVTPKVLLRAYTALRPVLSDLSSRYSLLHSSPQASSLPCQTL